MRVNIIGPSASGKTTLAKKISSLHSLEHLDLDYVRFEFLGPKKRRKISRSVYMKKVREVISKPNWVIEGINPIIEVFKMADLVIWLKPKFHMALFRQWKRYFTDPRQRYEHGFISNIKLSRYIIRQYFEVPTPDKDPNKTWTRSVQNELRQFQEKLHIIDSRDKEKQFFEILKKFNN